MALIVLRARGFYILIYHSILLKTLVHFEIPLFQNKTKSRFEDQICFSFCPKSHTVCREPGLKPEVWLPTLHVAAELGLVYFPFRLITTQTIKEAVGGKAVEISFSLSLSLFMDVFVSLPPQSA